MKRKNPDPIVVTKDSSLQDVRRQLKEWNKPKNKPKNKAAVALGRRGGKARAGKLTPAERSEIARKAGLAGGRGRAKTQYSNSESTPKQ